MFEWALFLAGGLLSGIMNAVAGGGSFIVFPMFVAVGIAPVIANATTTICVQPGSISSAYGYRKYLAKLPRHYYWLLIPALLGGVTGAYILSRTSNTQFGKLSPFFLLFALVLLILQPLLHRWLFSKQGLALERKHRWAVMGVVAVLFFMVATYGGYFGAGYGIITLAFLSLTELHDINQMNGLKNLGAICLGITAIAYLLTKNLIDLSLVPWVVTGNLLGGYLGATYSSKLSRRAIRTLVIVIGAVITALLFRKYH